MKETLENIISDTNKVEKLAYLLGALFGDGCFYKKDGGRIIFGCCDKDFILSVVSSVKSLFDINVNVRKINLSSKNIKWKDFYTFSSRPLFRLLKDFSDLKLPNFIENSENEIKAAFIKGFFDAEGNIDIHTIKKRNEIQRHIRCFSNNRSLLEDIKNILIKDFNIKCMISKNKGKTLCLTIWGYRSIKKFEENISFNILRKKILLQKAISSYKEIQMQWDKNIYSKVLEIRKSEHIGAAKIQTKLRSEGFNIPKPTIEHWIYAKNSRGGK